MAIDKINKTSTERQGHGKVYEMKVIEKYDLIPSDNNTSKWDAYTKSGIPVSIKCSQTTNSDLTGTVGMGDIFRQIDCNEDFYMIVGRWSKAKGKYTIIREDIMYIPGKEWHKHFNENLKDYLLDIIDNKMNNNRSYDAKWREVKTELHNKWGATTDGIIKLCPKRDHKTQRRIQCEISGAESYRKLYNKYKVSNII